RPRRGQPAGAFFCAEHDAGWPVKLIRILCVPAPGRIVIAVLPPGFVGQNGPPADVADWVGAPLDPRVRRDRCCACKPTPPGGCGTSATGELTARPVGVAPTIVN